MLDLCKLFKKIGIKKEKIFFCYFDKHPMDYTPLDIGYILAILKKKGLMKKFDFEIMPLDFFHHIKKYSVSAVVERESRLICQKNPRAIFFFLDNVLWSSVFALERTKKIASAVRKINPEIFIGLQSYKFSREDLVEIFSSQQIDCAVGNDPEASFLLSEKILRKEEASGVIYDSEASDPNNLNCQSHKKTENKEGDLDFIPSPYLTGILDDSLKRQKKIHGKGFCCFLYSSRGCRFGCYYCARSVKFENVKFFSAQRFYDEIEYLNSRFGFFRFFVLDDAFLFLPERLKNFEKEMELRKARNPRLGNLHLAIMARAESLDEESVAILKRLGVTQIQVGLQTINPNLIHYMNRKIPTEKFTDISIWLKKYEIRFYLDIIVGLPGDTSEYLEKTVDFAISLSPTNIQAKQFFLNSGTLFYQERKKYKIRTEKSEREFEAPFVKEAINIDDGYHLKAYKYLIQKSKEYPEIKWKIFSHFGKYVSFGFHSRF
jgi:radical SAM superfamily enzyme YgiQ (UPF0313 family)